MNTFDPYIAAERAREAYRTTIAQFEPLLDGMDAEAREGTVPSSSWSEQSRLRALSRSSPSMPRRHTRLISACLLIGGLRT